MKPLISPEEAQKIRDVYENDPRYAHYKFSLNLLKVLERPQVNIMTLQELEYFTPLFKNRPTSFVSAQEENQYEATIRQLTQEYQSRFSVYFPTVIIESRENPVRVKEFPVAPPMLMRYRDSEGVSKEAQEIYEKEVQQDLCYQGHQAIENRKHNQALHNYFSKIVAPDYNQPEVIQEIADARQCNKRRHELFYLYKQAASEGRLAEVIQKMEGNAPSAPSPATSPSSVPTERTTLNADEDVEVEDYEIL